MGKKEKKIRDNTKSFIGAPATCERKTAKYDYHIDTLNLTLVSVFFEKSIMGKLSTSIESQVLNYI